MILICLTFTVVIIVILTNLGFPGHVCPSWTVIYLVYTGITPTKVWLLSRCAKLGFAKKNLTSCCYNHPGFCLTLPLFNEQYPKLAQPLPGTYLVLVECMVKLLLGFCQYMDVVDSIMFSQPLPFWRDGCISTEECNICASSSLFETLLSALFLFVML